MIGTNFLHFVRFIFCFPKLPKWTKVITDPYWIGTCHEHVFAIFQVSYFLVSWNWFPIDWNTIMKRFTPFYRFPILVSNVPKWIKVPESHIYELKQTLMEWNVTFTRFCNFPGFLFWFPLFLNITKVPQNDFHELKQILDWLDSAWNSFWLFSSFSILVSNVPKMYLSS